MFRRRVGNLDAVFDNLVRSSITRKATRAMQGWQEPEPGLSGKPGAAVASKSGRVARISITVGGGGTGPDEAVLAGDATPRRTRSTGPATSNPFNDPGRG